MAVGVSVVICCHNSTKHLPATLHHLAAQVTPRDLAWEVLIVDNASTDDTALAAKSLWPTSLPVALRVVTELKPGTAYARQCGLREATYDLVAFVDDDNSLQPNWVHLAFTIMQEHPEVGVCGGSNEVVAETQLPSWFEKFESSYAVGPWANESGDVTLAKAKLWTAGTVMRRVAWVDLTQKGFTPILSGRVGTSTNLAAGEDTELCLALRVAGWSWWHDPRLKLKHCISEARLNWKYLRRLQRGSGVASVGHDPYKIALTGGPDKFHGKWIRGIWVRQIVHLGRQMMTHPFKLLRSFCQPLEGDQDVLVIEWQVGRLQALLSSRSQYTKNIHLVWESAWRQKEGQPVPPTSRGHNRGS